MLDHPNRDRIVVARSPGGPWIYASVPDYVPRAADEPAEQALLGSAARSTGPGQGIGGGVRAAARPAARRGEVPLEQVRDRLRTGLPLDFEGALTPPPYPRGRERALNPIPPSGGSVVPKSELNRRRYDWSPPVDSGPRETDVERRLGLWREAQAATDRRPPAGREVSPPAPTAPFPQNSGRPISDGPPTHGGVTTGSPGNSELGRRRYDWTPAPPDS